jgi:hypothetical protein
MNDDTLSIWHSTLVITRARKDLFPDKLEKKKMKKKSCIICNHVLTLTNILLEHGLSLP